MLGKFGRLACALLAIAGMADAGVVGLSAAEPLAPDYNRQVRPILSNYCFKCHGPDANERKSGLRLDLPEAARQPAESGNVAVVPGAPAKSELIRRIFSADPDEQMPPADSTKKLSDEERNVLKRWIEHGAPSRVHWAFVTPQRPAVPAVKDSAWPRNAVDHFILARLEAEKLRPAREADKVTLIRRLTLDLTGLPPTPAEVEAFVADASESAYEKVVDRLLASPHYGERMAIDWLDASRFADTHGYHIDSGRDMTRWRDWVIASFNRNLPFDQFTIDQLAGDLLPNATLEQKVASGFHRNHMINFEGGAIPQEYHNAYIVDRVNTTGTVWLGLTVACAQCHDHKYDPLSQKDYYQLYAFFYNVPENGLDGSKGNAAPLLQLPSEDQQRQLDQFAKAIEQVEQQLANPSPELDAAQAQWEKIATSNQMARWVPLEPTELKSRNGTTLTRNVEDRSIVASGENPAKETYTIVATSEVRGLSALRLEALPDDRLAGKGPGRSSNGNLVLTDVRVSASPVSDPTRVQVLKWKAASADFSQPEFTVAHAIDDQPQTGWGIFPEVGVPHQAVFEFDRPWMVEGAVQLTITLDFQSPYSQHQLGRFRLAATESRLPHGADKLPAALRDALALAPAARTPQQRDELRKFFRTNVATEERELHEKLTALKKAQEGIEKVLPTTMVMEEMSTPRETFVRIRGAYDKLGDKVSATVPSFLPPLPAGAAGNRHGFAQWLVDPSHPLTARVTVNRLWQTFFGTGLVKTTEDFGSQGESPSHPELLDWLALEFQSPVASPSSNERHAWNVKALAKLLVMSAAYRQSSQITPDLLNRDPENRLLARGPRLRLQAEFIRDQALMVSGLLNDEIGGRSVSPYQPAGIWEELASRADGKNWTAQEYSQSHGRDLYRRTMYTYWKRTAPPPTLVTFDAPDRETCVVRRARTNTPLQALILMNDPTYVEAARKLAERMMLEGGASAESRIAFAFRLATARAPIAREVSVLKRVYERQLVAFRTSSTAADKVLSVGESPRDDKLNAGELAAWTMVASVILNLDETLTKG